MYTDWMKDGGQTFIRLGQKFVLANNNQFGNPDNAQTYLCYSSVYCLIWAYYTGNTQLPDGQVSGLWEHQTTGGLSTDTS